MVRYREGIRWRWHHWFAIVGIIQRLPCSTSSACENGRYDNYFYVRHEQRTVHATPRHATPRHATPRHATPRRAAPRMLAHLHVRMYAHALTLVQVLPAARICVSCSFGFVGIYSPGDTSMGHGALPFMSTRSPIAQQTVVIAPAVAVTLMSCSGSISLTAASGMISDGPQDYTPFQQCEWIVQHDKPVTLSFEFFETESGYDVLSVFDGSTASSELLGSFSGSTMPPTVTSSGTMMVRFVSDGSLQRSGFVGRYSKHSVTETALPTMDTHSPSNATETQPPTIVAMFCADRSASCSYDIMTNMLL